MPTTILVCRSCGARAALDLAVNEKELANVGMLERRCSPCGRDTPWGLLEDYRKRDRRVAERRATARRSNHHGTPAAGERRRTSDRRFGDMRRGQRRGNR